MEYVPKMTDLEFKKVEDQYLFWLNEKRRLNQNDNDTSKEFIDNFSKIFSGEVNPENVFEKFK